MQVMCSVHIAPPASQVAGDLVVGGGEEVDAFDALGSVVAQLDLVFGVPAGVVADDGDEWQVVAHGGVEFKGVEAEAAVAYADDDSGLGAGEAGG